MLRRKGESLIEILLSLSLFSFMLFMIVNFFLSSVNFLSALKRQDEYIFNVSSALNYSSISEREEILEFFMNNGKNNIIFTRGNDDEIFLRIKSKSDGSKIFEIAR